MMVLFCVVVGSLLFGTYTIIYSIFARELRVQLDERLNQTATWMVKDLAYNTSDEDVFGLGLTDEYLELLDSSGRPLNMSQNWRDHPIDVGALEFPSGKPVYRTVQGVRGSTRVELVPFELRNRAVVFAIAGPTRDIDAVLASFRRILIVLFPVSFLLVGAVSAWYVGRSLSPIAELNREAAQLTQLLSQPGRADLKAPSIVFRSQDELGQLASTFNELFTRVVSVLQQLRQFVSDASHELRTPLSILQGETELLLIGRRKPEEYVRELSVMHGEIRHLTRIVEALFTLSMADARQLKIRSDVVYVNEVLEEACEIAIPLGRTKGICIEQNIEKDVASAGDESLLRDLFIVFLENAVKYSAPNTRISVSLRRGDGWVMVRFEDQGMGIAPEHLPYIFERFYRAVGPEGVETRGGGLGLAIALAIANAHNATIDVQTQPGIGSIFTVKLPLVPACASSTMGAPTQTAAG
jgi:signal transduction histidine kinase